ncbi:hypothetical protein DICPUDRAFT_31942 [Dictyostelium purpureum]|uniref:Eukaryotic translation initiation factor 3 subunit E n=1 Tax=Dictyostelium purpureum TaxID=5786 RepID=F0ZI56_DICPU|nr:uncharacterized protein DICPUDRAFT_31942 [Dictyostelium purpureum]EGC36403.1 hypothetical protein DICPUDRAFT_31942 [Dictyostelium purpureum]|eukprot:XP_003287100.1 hypothetical protein DICPUDRAFT_31942 [Dictyostelium purpureum]
MEYDLTKQIWGFLDSHMMLPLVKYLNDTQQYSENEINKAMADILSNTGCCDYAIDAYKATGRDTAPLQEKKKQLVEELNKLKEECSFVTQYIESKRQQKEQQKELKEQQKQEKEAAAAAAAASDKTEESTTTTTTTTPTPAPTTTTTTTPTIQVIPFSQLQETVTPAILESIYRFSKLLFETGQYGSARDHLEIFLQLSQHSISREKRLSALWGILESDILSLNWTAAVNDISPLQDQIDSNGSPIEQLGQRAWLIHRALFVYFYHPDSRSSLVDLLLEDKYLNAIQTTCPHILRYLAVAIIVNKKKQQSNVFQRVLNALIRVVEQESYVYRDPVTAFISNLFVKFNFDEAQAQLTLCEKVLKNDFFLHTCVEEFMENSRVCVFETYCNILENIDIDMLCKNLGIPQESSEKWIVEAIRNTRFTAKIDSANNQIKMFTQHNSYRQVMDKTKALFNRGIEIVVGINESRTQQNRKGDNKDRKNQRQNRNQPTTTSTTTTTTTTATTPTTTTTTPVATAAPTATA